MFFQLEESDVAQDFDQSHTVPVVVKDKNEVFIPFLLLDRFQTPFVVFEGSSPFSVDEEILYWGFRAIRTHETRWTTSSLIYIL